MQLADLRTPALILDRTRLRRNLQRMRDRAAELGVALRPHLKTAKSVDVAHLATDGHPGGITVSTLAEAEYFTAAGYRDLLYSVGATPDKLTDIAAILQQHPGCRILLTTDDAAAASALAERAAALKTRFDMLIEIDCGQHRAGIAPDGAELPAIAAILAGSPWLQLNGVLTHAGHSYNCNSVNAIRVIAEAERAAAVAAAERLRAAGHDCPVVSVGSSPTALFAERLDGVSEMRPGVYMFQDLFQAGLGCCDPQDIAVTLLATVVGGRRDGRVLIDAGGLALSQDTCVAGPDGAPAYGRVWDAGGTQPLGDAHIAAVNQEHGFVVGANRTLQVGDRVRVLPNHACMMAAMHEQYHVVEDGEDIVEIWPRGHGW